MRVVIQRVSSASVSVNSNVVGSIDTGLVLFVAISHDDTDEDIQYVVEKIVGMRIFSNEQGRFDRSLKEVSGALLVISQFTLYADTRKGRRPSFSNSASSDTASPLFDRLLRKFQDLNVAVETGRFGEMMDVALVNDGPVTIIINSEDRYISRH